MLCAGPPTRSSEQMRRARGCSGGAVPPVPCPAPLLPWQEATGPKPSFWGQKHFSCTAKSSLGPFP